MLHTKWPSSRLKDAKAVWPVDLETERDLQELKRCVVVRNVVLVKEKEFQATVRSYAQAKGWLCWATWKSFHSPAGEPDLRLIRPPRVLFVELKSEQGKLSEAQMEAQQLLLCCPGIEVYLWKPSDWDRIEMVLE